MEAEQTTFSRFVRAHEHVLRKTSGCAKTAISLDFFLMFVHIAHVTCKTKNSEKSFLELFGCNFPRRSCYKFVLGLAWLDFGKVLAPSRRSQKKRPRQANKNAKKREDTPRTCQDTKTQQENVSCWWMDEPRFSKKKGGGGGPPLGFFNGMLTMCKVHSWKSAQTPSWESEQTPNWESEQTPSW